MENKLEHLLNSLIEKGWKPFGWEVREAKKGSYNNLYYGFDNHPELYHIRMLVSIDSGLWQFVCEKGYEIALEGEKPYIEWDYIFDSEYYDISDYQYWLMVGALLDEDKLEDFLLSNINIKG